MYVCVLKGRRRELEAVVCYLRWILRIKPRSSAQLLNRLANTRRNSFHRVNGDFFFPQQAETS